MSELICEEDFAELPEEAAHKWIHLEKIAKARLDTALASSDDGNSEQLMLHYMSVIKRLADQFDVPSILISSETSVVRSYKKFQLSVSTAKAAIWAGSTATFPLGRVKLENSVKKTILELTSQIELQIESLDLPNHRRVALYKSLEDFRREINQPRTRIGSALASLSQIAGVVALSVTALAEGPDAYSTILTILGAEQADYSNPSILLVSEEKLRLLPAPPKLIEDFSGKE